MILEERRDNPDQINQEEVQVHRVHQVDQAVLHQIDHHLRIELHHRVHQADLQEVALHRVHQVDQADLHQADLHQADLHHQIDHLLRVHQADQADLAIQVVIVQEVRDQVEAEVHGLEKMNNAMIAVLN
jgi:uncharacterized protein YjbI with pentapeptide repeats